MNKISAFIIVLFVLLAACAPVKKANNIVGNDKITVAAYYFPNYHEDSRNASYHCNGWTEWELMKLNPDSKKS